MQGLDQLLNPVELDALRRRAVVVAEIGIFPDPGTSHRAYPWPLV